MKVALAAVSLGLGATYVSFGVITAVDLLRERSMGVVWHFGRPILAIARTCGPDYLGHGIHLGTANGRAGPVELLTVAAVLPTGLVWLSLRVEAMAGGRGDGLAAGTPPWLRAGPSVVAAHSVVVVSAGLAGSLA